METLGIISPEFWRGRKVFVTGHTGFKGGWLCLWLQQLGAKVAGFSLPPTSNPNLFNIARIAQGMESRFGDIRNRVDLTAAIVDAQPEIVIHMAAQSLVRYSYVNPVETYEVNVIGTMNLLEAVRQIDSIRAIVNITSDKCYENREWPWGYRESEAMGGYDPYSSSKGCAELITAAYRNSYFNPSSYETHRVALASARAGNVIGGGDWASDRLVPDVIRAIEEGCEVVIRNPRAIRPWQHVLEPLSGYLSLAQRLVEFGPDYAEAWNFGPQEKDAVPVSWLVEALAKKWASGTRVRFDEKRVALHEAHNLKLDCSKAMLRLGWSPRWPLSKALDHVVAWHKSLHAGRDMQAVTIGQINSYSSEYVVNESYANVEPASHRYSRTG
ncbi:MAG: CDP-glucose 4,6-dehydratase [Pseudomonadota bacterium]